MLISGALQSKKEGREGGTTLGACVALRDALQLALDLYLDEAYSYPSLPTGTKVVTDGTLWGFIGWRRFQLIAS